MPPELRAKLAEGGAVVVDESELGRLGIDGVGDSAQVGGHPVRVVGLLNGLGGVSGPYVFCSPETARRLVSLQPGFTTYALGRCRSPEQAEAVVARLRRAGAPSPCACPEQAAAHAGAWGGDLGATSTPPSGRLGR